ncbi:MAG: hypothetical protein IBJ12_11860 [Sphingomonadaceae bacterium]|nr:hypothetical protein [Sphingomonadaceae bacterium]
MTYPETLLERRFWRFWLTGLLLLAAQIVMNVWLITDIAPLGISDHQAAGTATRVNEIQASWESAAVMKLARLSMLVDLCFIGIYTFGAAAGGLLFAREKTALLKRVGVIVLVCAILFGITDYVETISQFVQAMRGEGSDALAGLAASVRPIKSVAFLITFFGLLAALWIRRTARRTG